MAVTAHMALEIAKRAVVSEYHHLAHDEKKTVKRAPRVWVCVRASDASTVSRRWPLALLGVVLDWRVWKEILTHAQPQVDSARGTVTYCVSDIPECTSETLRLLDQLVMGNRWPSFQQDTKPLSDVECKKLWTAFTGQTDTPEPTQPPPYIQPSIRGLGPSGLNYAIPPPPTPQSYSNQPMQWGPMAPVSVPKPPPPPPSPPTQPPPLPPLPRTARMDMEQIEADMFSQRSQTSTYKDIILAAARMLDVDVSATSITNARESRQDPVSPAFRKLGVSLLDEMWCDEKEYAACLVLVLQPYDWVRYALHGADPDELVCILRHASTARYGFALTPLRMGLVMPNASTRNETFVDPLWARLVTLASACRLPRLMARATGLAMVNGVLSQAQTLYLLQPSTLAILAQDTCSLRGPNYAMLRVLLAAAIACSATRENTTLVQSSDACLLLTSDISDSGLVK